ncbi:MAG: histidine kinase [Kangiellaceae bacterium]|nr:histidine kinase [Kangiellaceae bacterium]
MSKANLPEFFLPDFCKVQSVFMVVLIGELLAVIFTLLSASPAQDGWQVLGLYSISLQWVSLSSVGTLCLLRPSLAGLRDSYAGLISLLIILTATFIYTFITIRFYFGMYFDLSEPSQYIYLIRNLIIAGLIGSVLLRYFYLQQQYRHQISLESAARLEALQARIRPHFLFNSMNVIASLTRIDPKKAETAIEDLSDLIRATLNTQSELIPLDNELENGKRYLGIEQLRLGERLKIDWQIDPECLSCLVPPLSVQPLLENAVYHGIQMVPDGGVVTIRIEEVDKQVLIEVTNPKLEESKHKGHGIALNNITQRLEVIFNGQASLAQENLNDIYRVSMRIPFNMTLDASN